MCLTLCIDCIEFLVKWWKFELDSIDMAFGPVWVVSLRKYDHGLMCPVCDGFKLWLPVVSY